MGITQGREHVFLFKFLIDWPDYFISWSKNQSRPLGISVAKVWGENLLALCNCRQQDKSNHKVWLHGEEGPGLYRSISLPIPWAPCALHINKYQLRKIVCVFANQNQHHILPLLKISLILINPLIVLIYSLLKACLSIGITWLCATLVFSLNGTRTHHSICLFWFLTLVCLALVLLVEQKFGIWEKGLRNYSLYPCRESQEHHRQFLHSISTGA